MRVILLSLKEFPRVVQEIATKVDDFPGRFAEAPKGLARAGTGRGRAWPLQKKARIEAMKVPNFPDCAPPISGRVETRLRAGRPAAAGRGAAASGFPGRPAAGGAVEALPCGGRGGPLFRKTADEAGAGGVARRGLASADAPAVDLGLREIGQGEADAGIALPAKRDRGAGGWPSAACRGAGAEDAGASAPGFGDGLAAGSSGKARPNGIRGGSSCGKREGRKMEPGTGAG